LLAALQFSSFYDPFSSFWFFIIPIQFTFHFDAMHSLLFEFRHYKTITVIVIETAVSVVVTEAKTPWLWRRQR
jgi:hypothetical protein